MKLSRPLNNPMRTAHLGRFLTSASRLPFSHSSVSPTTFPKATLSFSRSPRSFRSQILSLASSMASENFSTAAADDSKHGFSRPEMYKEKLAGTVDPYDRHVFLCYKNHEVWPARVEASDLDPLPQRLAKTVKSRKNDMTIKTKITICEAREGAGFLDGDVLIFPEMIKYRGLTESNIDSFVDDVMVNDKPWSAGVQDEIAGSYIFVCAHASRDVRCGVCGPVLIKKFNEEIEVRGLKDQVFVWACSHVGGHKYAGNAIIYSPGPDGKIMGHWYGYVTPNDVPEFLDHHIAKGEIIRHLWRGQMGPSVEEVEGTEDHKVPNGELTDKGKNENVGGCCQGANGVSCCMTASIEKNKGIGETIEGHKKQGHQSSRSWSLIEEHNVRIAVGVFGILAAATVAYKIYRRSS